MGSKETTLDLSVTRSRIRTTQISPRPGEKLGLSSRRGVDDAAEGGHLEAASAQLRDEGCESKSITGQMAGDDQVAPALTAEALQICVVDVNVYDRVYTVLEAGFRDWIAPVGSARRA